VGSLDLETSIIKCSSSSDSAVRTGKMHCRCSALSDVARS